MATLVHRHLFWVHHGQVTPCVVVAQDLTTATCDIVATQQRYTVDACSLYGEVSEAARAAAADERKKPMWTLDTVKRELPPVPIRIGKRLYMGRITGRRLPHATVSVGETGYPFAWATIVRVLNTGEALYVPVADEHTSTCCTRRHNRCA